MDPTQELLDDLIADAEDATREVRDARRALALSERRQEKAQLRLTEHRWRMDIAERTRLAVEAEQRRATA